MSAVTIRRCLRSPANGATIPSTMTRLRCVLGWAAILVATAGCAARSPHDSVPPADRDLLTQEDLREHRFSTVFSDRSAALKLAAGAGTGQFLDPRPRTGLSRRFPSRWRRDPPHALPGERAVHPACQWRRRRRPLGAGPRPGGYSRLDPPLTALATGTPVRATG